jgi:hypothetical protein
MYDTLFGLFVLTSLVPVTYERVTYACIVRTRDVCLYHLRWFVTYACIGSRVRDVCLYHLLSASHSRAQMIHAYDTNPVLTALQHGGERHAREGRRMRMIVRSFLTSVAGLVPSLCVVNIGNGCEEYTIGARAYGAPSGF